MMGMWRVQSPHAALEVSLSEGAYSLLRRAYPNEGNVRVAIAAREVGSQPVRESIY